MNCFFLRSTWQDYDRSDYRTLMNASRSKLASEERRYMHPRIGPLDISFNCRFTVDNVVSCIIIHILMFTIFYSHQLQCFCTSLNRFLNVFICYIWTVYLRMTVTDQTVRSHVKRQYSGGRR